MSAPTPAHGSVPRERGSPTEAGGVSCLQGGDRPGGSAQFSEPCALGEPWLGSAPRAWRLTAPCHPPGLACRDQKPQVESGPGGPGGRPCSGGRDVLPPRGSVACQHSRGQELGGLPELCCSELPGAERGVVKRHTGGDRSHHV